MSGRERELLPTAVGTAPVGIAMREGQEVKREVKVSISNRRPSEAGG
jgi:hypothetical protein